jgi:hypothetical protein
MWDSEATNMCNIEMSSAMDDRACQINGMLIPLLSNKFLRLENLYTLDPGRLGTNEEGLSIGVQTDQWFHRCYQKPGQEEAEMVVTMCKDIVLAPILYTEKARYVGEEGAWCLMLFAQPGLTKGTYRRVGLGRISISRSEDTDKHGDRASSYSTLLSKIREYQEPLQNEWYHETSGSGDYAFSIV